VEKAPSAEKPPDPKITAEPPPTETSSARETAMYVASGVGVLALASGTYFGLRGTSAVDDMRATCAPDCAKDDVDAARTKLVAANVSFGLGVGALAIAGMLWLSGPSDPPKSSTARARFVGVGVRPSPFGRGGELVTTFSAP
jgi:hypothetical protein